MELTFSPTLSLPRVRHTPMNDSKILRSATQIHVHKRAKKKLNPLPTKEAQAIVIKKESIVKGGKPQITVPQTKRIKITWKGVLEWGAEI